MADELRRIWDGLVADGLRVPGELQEELGAHEKGIEAARAAIGVRSKVRDAVEDIVAAYLAATDLVPLAAVVEALNRARVTEDWPGYHRAAEFLLARFGSTEGNDHDPR